jgi:hypothetical protein
MVFFIDNETRERIAEVIKFAEETPFAKERLEAVMNGLEPIPGNNDGYVVMFPGGLRVVYTIEDNNGVLAKHLSASVPDEGRYPAPEIMDIVLASFGMDMLDYDEEAKKFRNMKNVLGVWVEEGSEAVNILQKY